MILVDPDLEPDPAASRAAGSPSLRLPSTQTMGRFLTAAKAAVRLRGQVTVLLTGDAAIRNLNRRFRGKNKPTDVLSFPADSMVTGAERIAGDLAISIPTARRQAALQNHTLSIEIKVLMLHGLLHLAGYDHETDSGEMERRERRLRAWLGLPGGLIERSSTERGSIKRGLTKRAIRQPAQSKNKTGRGRIRRGRA